MMEKLLAAYEGALLVVGAVGLGLAMWREGSEEEDKMVSEAHDIILDTVSDADKRSKLGCLTGREIGREITVEQAEEMNKERELRRFGHQRN